MRTLRAVVSALLIATALYYPVAAAEKTAPRKPQQTAQRGQVRRVDAVTAEPYFDGGRVLAEPFEECSVCGGESCCECAPGFGWSAGAEAVIVKPHFEENIAFTTLESDAASFESFSDTEFNYDTEATPRVWLELFSCQGFGLRAQYWQFDHAAATAVGTPPANGFGQIIHPPFGDVDITTTIPDDTFTTSTALNAYTVDLEATMPIVFDCWGMMASLGLRYGSIDQGYTGRLRDNAGTLQGSVDYQHTNEGVGPTFALRGERPLGCQWVLFGKARGSLLFGDSTSTLNAGEDLDLAAPFNTARNTERDDVLPISELQFGLRWLPPCRGRCQPYAHAALEGQLWSDVGNATSEDGDLGFFGFTVGLGAEW